MCVSSLLGLSITVKYVKEHRLCRGGMGKYWHSVDWLFRSKQRENSTPYGFCISLFRRSSIPSWPRVVHP
jgi:hypothetical protein